MGLFSRLFGKPAPTPAPIAPAEVIKALFPEAPRYNPDAKPLRGERQLASMLPSYSYRGGWTDDRIKQVHHFTYWLYVGVSIICDTIAGMGSPNVAWVGSTARGRKSGASRNRLWRKSQNMIKPHEEVEHVPLNHPLLRLFDQPNAYDVNYDLWYELFLFKKLTGSTFLWSASRNGIAGTNGLGLPSELWVAPSHWMQARSNGTRLIDYYEMRPWGGSAGRIEIDPRDLVHIKSKNPLSKVDGMSALSAGAKWIDTSESTDSARWAQMKNQMRPELVLKLRTDADPDDDELERFYKKFDQRFGGELKTGLPLITSGSVEEVIPLEYPAEIFYIQTAEQMRDFVLCGLLRVPKEVIGIQPSGSDLSWYAPLRQFCSAAINPELRLAGQVLTKFAKQWDESLRVWWDDCTPDNPEQVNKDIAQDFAVGAITPNEVRAIRGREDYKHGGDDPLLPMTLAPVPLNTGDDHSDLGDLVPQMGGGGAEEQPQLDEFGNPVEPMQEPVEANGQVAHDPADPMAAAREAFAVNGNADPMAGVRDIFSRAGQRGKSYMGREKTAISDDGQTIIKVQPIINIQPPTVNVRTPKVESHIHMPQPAPRKIVTDADGTPVGIE